MPYASNGIRVYYNGFYINSFGGEGNLEGFTGYSQADAGSTLVLYEPPTSLVADLDNKSFAIVNRSVGDYAMTNDNSGTVNGVRALKAEQVTLTTASDGTFYVNGDNSTVIDVENNTGTELPSTGGMGTTIFYILGAVLVLGAVILLVTKKRMGSSER